MILFYFCIILILGTQYKNTRLDYFEFLICTFIFTPLVYPILLIFFAKKKEIDTYRYTGHNEVISDTDEDFDYVEIIN